MINSTVYHLLALTWGLRYFWERGNIRKRVCWNRGFRHLCVGVSKKIICKTYLLVYYFLLIKINLKALFCFIPWLLNFSGLLSYDLNWKWRYTLRLLSICLGRSIHPTGENPPFDSFFDSLRWAPFSLASHLYSS